METLDVKIRKPIYGNYVYISSTMVEMAIRMGAMMRIAVPNGTAIVDPVEWKKKGKIMKKVFRFPNNPLTLYGGYVPLSPKSKGKIMAVITEEKPKVKQTKLF